MKVSTSGSEHVVGSLEGGKKRITRILVKRIAFSALPAVITMIVSTMGYTCGTWEMYSILFERALAEVKEGFIEEELVPDIRDDRRGSAHTWAAAGNMVAPCPSARRWEWLAALSQKARPVPIVLCHMLHLERPLGTAAPISIALN